jgi:glycosyltransferase involved in cell wall biosynthesis
VLGYIGRLKEEKGLMTMVEALTMLPSYCQAVFIGFGPLKSALQKRAQELGVAPRVILRPGVATAEVPFQLQQMDVMILPSLTRPHWKEQFGRTLAEAMACETPVIGSDSGEIPNVVGDAGLIFKEGNAEALSHCVRRLLDERELPADLAARGRRRVLECYTPAHIAEQTYEVYRKIL